MVWELGRLHVAFPALRMPLSGGIRVPGFPKKPTLPFLLEMGILRAAEAACNIKLNSRLKRHAIPCNGTCVLRLKLVWSSFSYESLVMLLLLLNRWCKKIVRRTCLSRNSGSKEFVWAEVPISSWVGHCSSYQMYTPILCFPVIKLSVNSFGCQ